MLIFSRDFESINALHQSQVCARIQHIPTSANSHQNRVNRLTTRSTYSPCPSLIQRGNGLNAMTNIRSTRVVRPFS